MGRGPISLYSSFQKRPTGRGASQGCNSANEDVDTASRDTPASPPVATTGFPEALCLGPSCQRAIRHSDDSVREHLPSTTLGPQAWDSPSHVPSPWSGNQRLLKRKTTEISLSHPGGHSTTAHPLQGGGGLLLKPLDSEPPEKPIAPPGEMELPSQDPACLCSTNHKPRQFELETIIRITVPY